MSLAVWTAGFTGAAVAQPAAPATADAGQILSFLNQSPELAGQYNLDTAIPEAPGFTVMGLTPSKVVDPGVARVSFASLTSYLDEKGNLKPGFALGGSPYWWFNHTTLGDYQDTSRFLRLWARTQISAGYGGGDSSTPQKIGLGFSTEILDSADYRRDPTLYSCVAAATIIVLQPINPNDPDQHAKEVAQAQADWKKAPRPTLSPRTGNADAYNNDPKDELSWEIEDVAELHQKWLDSQKIAVTATVEKNYETAVKTCQTTFTQTHASWIIAGGAAFRTDSKSTASEGGSIWTSYKLPLSFGSGRPLPNYFGVFGRYDFQRKPDVTSFINLPTANQTEDRAIAALILGYEATGWKLSVQAGVEADNFHGLGPLHNDRYGFYSASYNYNVSKDVWLEFQGGSRGDQVSRSNHQDSYVILNVHMAPNLFSPN
ncbi:MAG: hypothetical protein WDN45_13115 [Caulobacteraceae bacterium]